MNWYDWNDLAWSYEANCRDRRDWSAWIDTIETTNISYLILRDTVVGIDLHELIRLKPGVITPIKGAKIS